VASPQPWLRPRRRGYRSGLGGADGGWITLVLDVVGGRQVWKLPYPQGKESPERILKGLNTLGATPRWSWFPGGRSGIISSTDEHGEHLWIAGIHSGLRQRVMTGTSSVSESEPALSPDGKKLLFVQSRADYAIISASLSDATVKRLISSEVPSGMPAWALHRQEFVYESHRDGSPAIWMRDEGWDRPVVAIQAFPAGSTNGFATPALSPSADRLVYTRVDNHQRYQDWISSISGGPPVRLTNETDVVERGGSWSPDGASIVYWEYRNGVASLMLVRSTGEAAPITLRQHIGDPLPEWSRDGQWISFLDPAAGVGWSIVSSDGKTVRSFGQPDTIQMTFSADSKRLYGIRVESDRCALYRSTLLAKKRRRSATSAGISRPRVTATRAFGSVSRRMARAFCIRLSDEAAAFGCSRNSTSLAGSKYRSLRL
jgi:Tol biopolymer transport system component